MMFSSSATNAEKEIHDRLDLWRKVRSFGVSYLDDATQGILPNDLVLLGAGSGVGKTEVACTIAISNILQGKQVHYIALEAEQYEIERRIKYQVLANRYFSDPNRPRGISLTYPAYALGRLIAELGQYEQQALEVCEKKLKNLFTFYKTGDFGIQQFTEAVLVGANKSDLIIVDHVHYFDLDDDRENRAMKQIAKTARSLSIHEGTPIILIAHLRKSDRGRLNELAPGMEEFHGSSDLYKIASKVITFGAGEVISGVGYETFFRVCKNRLDGSSTRYLGRMIFDPKRNSYGETYQVGWSSQDWGGGFEQVANELLPPWAKRQEALGSNHHSHDAQRKGQSSWL